MIGKLFVFIHKKLLNSIGNETLNQLADHDQRLSNRFVPSNENERI
jgi:hypothetical protein